MRSKWYLLFFCIFLLYRSGISQNVAFEGSSILTGGAGAAYNPSFESSQINPALSSFIPRNQLEGTLPIINKTTSIRYPGNPASTDSSFGPGYPISGGIYKPLKNIGLSLFAIPFSIETKVAKDGLPFLVLDQVATIKIVGTGTLKSLYDLGISYRFGKFISVGLRYYYLGFNGDIGIKDSQGSHIASVQASGEISYIQSGIFVAVHSKVGLGLTANITETVKNDLNMSTFADGTVQAKSDSAGNSTISQSLSKIRAGLNLKISSKLRLALDIEYKPKVERSAASIVDFKVKPVDTYATTSFHFGGEFNLDHRRDILFGVQNIPGSVGPGSRKNGVIGFGITDILTNLGEVPSKPVFTVGGGMRYRFGRVLNKKSLIKSIKKGVRNLPKRSYQFTAESGLAYSETSIGVDDSGEQPGAYLATRYVIPIKLIYNFYREF